MSQLTLSIKQNFFDDIIAGVKKNEIRQIRPQSVARYCETNEDGFIIGPRKYDTLKLMTGQFKGQRPYLIVEVMSSKIIPWEDFFETDEMEFIGASIEYKLGKILRTFKGNVHKIALNEV